MRVFSLVIPKDAGFNVTEKGAVGASSLDALIATFLGNVTR